MRKKKLIGIIFPLISLVIFSSFGCTAEKQKANSADSSDKSISNSSVVKKTDNEAMAVQHNSSTGNGENGFEIFALKVTNGNHETINNLLKSQKAVEQISWSPDNTHVAFSVRSMDWDDQMYLWDIGKTEPVEIKNVKDKLCSFVWSPDNEYVLADAGTSVERGGYVVNIKDDTKLDYIDYVGKAFWSPDSKWIAVGKVSDIQLNIAIELTGTVDLCIYNIETKEKKIISKGTADYYYSPEKWDSNGVLIFKKINVENPDKQETLTELIIDKIIVIFI